MANGIPILARWWLGKQFSLSIDAGYLLSDGYPIFGTSKTWRGLLLGILSASLLAIAFEFSIIFAIIFPLLSLLGDLFSSFIKRRLKMLSSRPFLGLDQIPEAILPLLFGAFWLGYSFVTVTIVTLSFFLLNIMTSPLFVQLGRKPRH